MSLHSEGVDRGVNQLVDEVVIVSNHYWAFPLAKYDVYTSLIKAIYRLITFLLYTLYDIYITYLTYIQVVFKSYLRLI